MLVHEFDLARIHNAARIAEAEQERLARIAQSARPARSLGLAWVVRLAIATGTVVAVAMRVLPIGI
jgi:class 3 adenylate cyclase